MIHLLTLLIAQKQIPRTTLRYLLHHHFRLFNQFFHFSFLTDTISQVIQFSTSYFTSSDNLNLLHVRRMHRPCLLHSYAI